MFHLELKNHQNSIKWPPRLCWISTNFIKRDKMLHNHIIWVCLSLVFIFHGLVGLINKWKVSKIAYFYRISKISHGGHLGFERLQNSSPTLSKHLNLISDPPAQHFGHCKVSFSHVSSWTQKSPKFNKVTPLEYAGFQQIS